MFYGPEAQLIRFLGPLFNPYTPSLGPFIGYHQCKHMDQTILRNFL